MSLGERRPRRHRREVRSQDDSEPDRVRWRRQELWSPVGRACTGDTAGGSRLGQGLVPSCLTRPAIDSWPTYAGDYSQRRYSALRQVDTSNVRHLSLAWVSRLTAGAGGGEGGFFGPPGTPPITGGVAENPVNIPGSTSGSPRLSGSILQVNGVLYVTSPDTACAMAALDGHIL